jgi:hypothetical protein
MTKRKPVCPKHSLLAKPRSRVMQAGIHFSVSHYEGPGAAA